MTSRFRADQLLSMIGLIILLGLLAAGFAAGFATRAVVSRQWRAVYLTYAPYLEGSRKATRLEITNQPAKTNGRAILHLVEPLPKQSDPKTIAD